MKKEMREELQELFKLQHEINNKIKNLEIRISDLNKNVWWKPRYKENYFYIDADTFNIILTENINHEFDERRINNFNCFKTKEEAEVSKKEILLKAKLRKFAFENNEKEIDWSDESQDKYCIVFDGKQILTISSIYRDFGQVYFDSKEVAESALIFFKEDLEEYFELV